jgi:AraC-like DNA-binding protein
MQWKDVLDIGPDCVELYVDPARVPEISGLEINVAGVSRLSGRYEVGCTGNEEHSLIYSISGQGRLFLEAGEYVIEGGSLSIVPAGIPFLMQVHKGPWQTAWFNLAEGAYWQSLPEHAVVSEYCEGADAIFHLLAYLYHEPSPEHRIAALGQLKRYLHDTASSKQESDRGTDNQRLRSLFRQVEKKLHYAWTVDEMCERAHYSAPHLHRLCREAYGRSPIQQLIYMRMQRARFLLAHTHWTLAQVASAVGYRDAFNFSHRFKKTEGIAPTQYRERMQSL